MSDIKLDYRCILVVEDEYMMADDLRQALEDVGCVVLGPVATVKQALAIIEAEAMDAAVLDINLGGEKSFPVADALLSHGIPFVFATGYSREDVPERYGMIQRCEKPVEPRQIISALAREVEGR